MSLGVVAKTELTIVRVRFREGLSKYDLPRDDELTHTFWVYC